LAIEHVLPNIPPLPQTDGEMKNAILELIDSYQNTISSVEGLISASNAATDASNDGLDRLAEERDKLTTNLQEALARNCSLRRKDFNRLMERILSASERKRKEIENERRLAGDILAKYLEEQKRLTASIKEHFVQFTQEDDNRDELEALVSEIKAATQEKGERVFVQLRFFQRRLDTFRQEQEEINYNMQRLLNRGKYLKLEDLRHIDAARERQDRKAQMEHRREDVIRLLAQYSQQRRWSSSHRSA